MIAGMEDAALDQEAAIRQSDNAFERASFDRPVPSLPGSTRPCSGRHSEAHCTARALSTADPACRRVVAPLWPRLAGVNAFLMPVGVILIR